MNMQLPSSSIGYCSEPRPGFNKAAVTRYRMHLESRGLALGTVNLRLAVFLDWHLEVADGRLSFSKRGPEETD